MGKRIDEITPELRDFIERQPVFFVGTAPRASDGHVNVSPKGLDTFRVLGPRLVAYLDLTGSGNETAAHVTENGRLTVMFCAFACLSLTSLSMAAAFSRIAVATLSHLDSWSGVILSSVFSIEMRCSTVCGLLDVAAAAAGGLVLPGLVVEVWADAPTTPRASDAPARVAMAAERRRGAPHRRVPRA